MKQSSLFKKQRTDYGGSLLNTRFGRRGPRPLATRLTMHLVLRSKQATGEWSFRKHETKIRALISKFSQRYGVRVISLANVGNHLHFQIKLGNRYTYAPFIRALTATIAMAVTGASRWSPLKSKFWDHRPFTRIVESFRGYLNLQDYIAVNAMESGGYSRDYARWFVKAFPGVG